MEPMPPEVEAWSLNHWTTRDVLENCRYICVCVCVCVCVYKYFFLFLAVLGLHCCSGFSLVVASRGYSLVAVLGLLIVVASLITEHGCRVCRL